MKIVILANNNLGLKVTRWLVQNEVSVVALVLNSPEKRSRANEIISGSRIPLDKIYEHYDLQDPETLQKIQSLGAEMAISILYGHKLDAAFLDIFPRGCINLHPSYLPFNKGAYTNVWPIIDQTTAGVTIHYMDNGIDTGPIIAQSKVEVEPVDTGYSLYQKLEKEAYDLFINSWDNIWNSKVVPHVQRCEEGSYHSSRDVASIARIDLDRFYRAGDLINILRARTYPHYKGAYFEKDYRRIYMKLSLEYED